MEESCRNCAFCYDAKVSDYSKGGCEETNVMNGYVCMAFQDEGLAILMIGVNKENEICEGYCRKKESERMKKDSVKPVDSGVYWQHRYSCGECGHTVFRNENYCSNCGTEVDWDDGEGSQKGTQDDRVGQTDVAEG